jgi:2-oxoglutarate dehydrogenase complex dehydrogenase (E1) component-like enzyme
MYERIASRRSVRKIYTETLVNRGDLTLDECELTLEDFRKRLEDAFAETQAHHAAAPEWEEPEAPARIGPSIDTGVPHETLDHIVSALVTWPDDFQVHPKLERLLKQRRTHFDDDEVDWALAEALAFGSLLMEGTPVRVAGQDTRRGTFSQRHSVLVEHETEAEYTPLAHLSDDQAPFMIYDSVLSEFAALGFEYGYSVAERNALVCWEAQFGDFSNGGQTIIDQFIVAAEDKWGQHSSLTLLLPHGFEGQGPEHSSARIERFLTLSAENNMRVVYPTTAAQYFHVLRRQVHDAERKPLIVFTPKRYLRVPATFSTVDELMTGGFRKTLPDPSEPDAATVQRLVVCTGKFGHELIAQRDKIGAPVSVLRIEQLYPFPEAEVSAELSRYPALREVVWAQEEPANMGAGAFVFPRLAGIVGQRAALRRVALPESPSPATGSQKVHDVEHAHLLDEAVSISA